MKKIVVGFSTPQKFKIHAWLIMKIDQAPFDHTYLKFHSESLNRDIIYQAVGKGVQFVGKTLFDTKSKSIEEFEIEVEDDDYTKMMCFCVDNAGIPYGFIQVIGAGIVKILSKFGKHIENPFNVGLTNEFCSEVVLRCLNKVDSKNFNLKAENITPKDLNVIIKSLNFKRIL